ncbi:MAG TPA: hypothetical protein VHZ25_09420 [Acidobacteriaceae bacterium]|nr:hypothetical protein [Acidobacteriaceae bacterium]
MENYFNYFTEIEDHFQRRRGSILLLSTLDWALIETWREGGIPLEAVLRGIDTAFDRYELRKHRTARRINGLAWCAQEVITAAEEMREAALGTAKPQSDAASAGLEWDRIATHLTQAAAQMKAAQLAGLAAENASEIADRLTALAAPTASAPNLEDLERNLTVLEEKLLNALIATAPEAELTALREQSAQELAPYRRRMQAVQIRQIEQQFLHKRLLEKHNLPRLSLFYMRQE